MRSFTCREVAEAKEFSSSGGQALHLHRIIPDRTTAPRCFVAAVDRGEDIAHLFDADEARLRATARRLGVKVIYIHHKGTPRQHIDLCGKPLEVAKKMCNVAKLTLHPDDLPIQLEF